MGIERRMDGEGSACGGLGVGKGWYVRVDAVWGGGNLGWRGGVGGGVAVPWKVRGECKDSWGVGDGV